MENFSRDTALTGELFPVQLPGETPRIVVVQASGTYRIGSAGKPDAAFLSALQDEAIRLRPNGIVLDFSALAYEWGDDIEEIFPGNDGTLGEDNLYCAVVVGPACREAIETLLCQCRYDTLDEVSWVYSSLADAIEGLIRKHQA